MSNEELMIEVEKILSLLPKVMRGLFSMDGDDPGMVLPAAQLRVCGILVDGPRTMSCLRKELHTSLSATTQIADRLEKAGLVERISEADDRRVKYLQLTEVGAQMMRIRHEKKRARLYDAIQRLTPEDTEIVIRALKILLEAGLASAIERDDQDCTECSSEESQGREL